MPPTVSRLSAPLEVRALDVDPRRDTGADEDLDDWRRLDSGYLAEAVKGASELGGPASGRVVASSDGFGPPSLNFSVAL